MRLDGRLGGHLVQGHVDGTGTLLDAHPRRALGGRPRLAARRTSPAMSCEKGSITVDGVSLTVAAVDDDRLQRQPDPDHARPDHARPQAGRRPGQPRGRRPRQVRRAPAGRTYRRRHPPPRPTEARHERLHRPLRRASDDRRPRHHLAGDPRQRVRPRVGRRRHAPPGLGLAGRHRRQRPAVHGLRLHRGAGDHGGTALRPGRPADLLHRSCRSTAGGAGGRTGAAAQAHRRWSPRWATGARARWRSWSVGRAAVGIVLRRRSARSAPASRHSWWYYWADAWIFVGSMVATYAMARGWVDFWLCWLAVDLVGVPQLLHFKFYPSAVLYGVYGVFVIWGFVAWLRIARTEVEPLGRPPRTRRGAGMSTGRRQLPSRRSTRSSARSPTSRAGRPVVVVDDEDRENEGDLVFAAAKATPELLGVHDPAHAPAWSACRWRAPSSTGSSCRR